MQCIWCVDWRRVGSMLWYWWLRWGAAIFCVDSYRCCPYRYSYHSQLRSVSFNRCFWRVSGWGCWWVCVGMCWVYFWWVGRQCYIYFSAMSIASLSYHYRTDILLCGYTITYVVLIDVESDDFVLFQHYNSLSSQIYAYNTKSHISS